MISGHVAAKIDVKRFMVLTFLFLGVVTIALGSLKYFEIKNWWIYAFLEIIEGVAQSMGFPVNLAIICNWFPKKGRGLIVGIWASCQPVGDIIGIQLF